MSDPSQRPTSHDIDDLRDRSAIYDAFDTALDRWPEVSALAFSATSVSALVPQLQALLDVDEIQATAVVEMQVRRVTQDSRARVREQAREHREALATALQQFGES